MPKEENQEPKEVYVTIYIHEPKQITESKSNFLTKKGEIVRVKGLLKKEKTWTTSSYMIQLKTLGLEENADSKEIIDRLLNPASIINKDAKALLMKLADQYGAIKQKGRDRLEYKTERFKKKWKMKARRVGGV
ncbi:MAG TPA: hypothetical protein VMV49_09035 [Candidatus Deferrimicrobium sp.]|nr:hypothetical protein [Candidatus Deferrimicrobium sp.]